MLRTRLIVSMLGLLLLATVLAACGNLSLGGAAQPDKVYFGVTGPMTGDNAEYGRIWKQGFALAIEEINAKGGVLGKPIELVIEDSQSDPKQTPAIAQKFVADKRLVAVIGDFASPASMAASPIYNTAGLPQLGITNSHPKFTDTGEYIFGTSRSQNDDAPQLADFATKGLGGKRLAVFHLNTDWGKVTYDLFVAQAKANGVEIVDTASYLPTEKDFRSALTKARDAKPDMLILLSYYNDAALIARQAEDVNLNVPKVGIGSIYSPKFIELGGKSVEGVYTTSGFFPQDPRPEVQEFSKKYQAKYNEIPDQFAAQAYDGIKLLAAGLEKAGKLDRKALRDALDGISGVPSVAYGKIDLGPDRRIKPSPQTRLVVNNGQFTVLKGQQ
jgi:branched-chain amino acid transport system substrate-binding protein